MHTCPEEITSQCLTDKEEAMTDTLENTLRKLVALDTVSDTDEARRCKVKRAQCSLLLPLTPSSWLPLLLLLSAAAAVTFVIATWQPLHTEEHLLGSFRISTPAVPLLQPGVGDFAKTHAPCKQISLTKCSAQVY